MLIQKYDKELTWATLALSLTSFGFAVRGALVARAGLTGTMAYRTAMSMQSSSATAIGATVTIMTHGTPGAQNAKDGAAMLSPAGRMVGFSLGVSGATPTEIQNAANTSSALPGTSPSGQVSQAGEFTNVLSEIFSIFQTAKTAADAGPKRK